MKLANWRRHNTSLANPLPPHPTHPFRCSSTSKLRDLALKMQAYRFTCKLFRHKHEAARNDGIQRRDGSRSTTKSLKLLQGRVSSGTCSMGEKCDSLIQRAAACGQFAAYFLVSSM
jgi:hypothetical protein